MKHLHILLSIFSLIVIAVTIERFSFTTKVLLPPNQFIRLHEVIQTAFLTTASVGIFVLLLKEVTQTFSKVKNAEAVFLVCLFTLGVYLYGAGEGAHEIASFTFNTFCPVKLFSSHLCKSLFINDYYFGNILYFLGGILMTLPLLIFERKYTKLQMKNSDIIFVSGNALIYAFGLFAYAAFDRVLLGLIYCIILLVLSAGFFFTYKKGFRNLPVTYYFFASFVIGTVPGIFIRFH